MPLIVPRATATFVDGAGLRFLQRSGVELGALQARDDGALNRLLEQTLPREVEDALQAVRADVEARMATVIAAVPAVDADARGNRAIDPRQDDPRARHAAAEGRPGGQAPRRYAAPAVRADPRRSPSPAASRRNGRSGWCGCSTGSARPCRRSSIGSCRSTSPGRSRPSTGSSRSSFQLAVRQHRPSGGSSRPLAAERRRTERPDEPCVPPRSRAPAFRPPPPRSKPAASGAGCAIWSPPSRAR